jgi:hypothetical protein
MTVRGGGVPYSHMASMPSHRMGPPPRSFRCDAHHCIMVRVSATHRIQVCGTDIRAHTRGSPRTSVIPTSATVPSCSEPSRPSLSVAAKGGQPLTAPARAGNSTRGRDEETVCQIEQRNCQIEQRICKGRDNGQDPWEIALTKISPYKCACPQSQRPRQKLRVLRTKTGQAKARCRRSANG